MSQKRRKQIRSGQPEWNLNLEVVHPNAAGIDIGNESHYVAIAPDRDPNPVRHFACFTEDLHRLGDWLKSCGIVTVAMQSTGVYWLPVYEILTEKGLEVFLVNARHTKNLPGRKTDVQECQWLLQLHTFGLLNNSFRPPEEICVLRAYWRQRGEHVAAAGARNLYQIYQQQIAECDTVMTAHLQTLDNKVEPGSQPPAAKPNKRAGSNAPTSFDVRGELYRISGTDLTQIDSINIMTAQTIIAEVGIDMSRFPTEAHFASFLGLCPDNQITGGEVLRRGTRHVQNRAATALRMAASTLWRSKTYLGAEFRRLRARLGAPKAITAMAHMLARLVYRMLRYGEQYVDKGMNYYEEKYRENEIRSIQKRPNNSDCKSLSVLPHNGSF
jgi:transposase